MPTANKKSSNRISSKKIIVVTKSKVAAKSAGDKKLAKVNKMLGKTKWLD